MSAFVLSVIPTDPRWQPEPARAEIARTLVAELLTMEHRSFDEIRITWHKQVAAVACGENLQRITCPHCAATIDTQWWSDLLEEHFREGFADLTETVPCCGRRTALTDLDYDWPCGFARLEIEIWNDWDPFTDGELESIAQTIGHPVRQILAHF